MNRFETWRRHLRQWLIPLVFCALNVVALFVYSTAFAGETEGLGSEKAAVEQELARLENDRRASEEFLARIEERREGEMTLYEDYFSTNEKRFTKALIEVRQLARRAGLSPQTWNYPDKELKELNLDQREFVFQVEGTYDQFRNFINFLELTEQFLTVERISLNESGNDERNPSLSIQIVLSTVFVDTSSEKQKGAES